MPKLRCVYVYKNMGTSQKVAFLSAMQKLFADNFLLTAAEQN